MTIITAVKFDDHFAIATDSQTTFGPTRLGDSHNRYASKIIEADGNYFACGSWAASCDAFRHLMENRKTIQGLPDLIKNLCLKSWSDVMEFSNTVHVVLKANYHLTTQSQNTDQPTECGQFTYMIANKYGIWSVGEHRDVYEHEKFWAIGSGDEYALGAMEVAMDDSFENGRNAKEIAQMGAEASCKFDTNCGSPVYVHGGELELIKVEHG